MKITILKPLGYCAGVRNAINIARKAREDYPNKRVIIVGMLVHNSHVIEELQKEGIETFYDPTMSAEKLVQAIPYGGVVVFTAHGHDEKLEYWANRRGLIIYDAVCPKVKMNLTKIKYEISRGHQVIFIGQLKHPETNAALSISKDVLLYDVNQRFEYLDVVDASPYVVNQTTLNFLNLTAIHQDIYSCLPNARIEDEICNTTRLRQQAIIDLPETVDLIVIIGDQISSNTMRLYEIAKQSHPEIISVMFSNEADIDDSIFNNKKHVAIASGASTPTEVIEAVLNHIKKLA